MHDLNSSLDPEVFSHEYDDLYFVHTLSMQTDDMGKAGSYLVIIKAYNEFYPDNFITKNFTLTIDMSLCLTITG